MLSHNCKHVVISLAGVCCVYSRGVLSNIQSIDGFVKETAAELIEILQSLKQFLKRMEYMNRPPGFVCSLFNQTFLKACLCGWMEVEG